MKNLKHLHHLKTRQVTLVFALSFLFLYAGNPVEVKSQNFDGLEALAGFSSQVYFSAGNEERAEAIARRCDKAIKWYSELLNFRPSLTLLILDPEDWGRFTSFPVYGMPHYKDDHTLVVASRDNDFWKSFIPPVNQLPAGLAENIRDAYTGEDGNLTMGPFFDLLALHELGHAFHIQSGLNMQRKWIGELFVNMFLHTYIAENEPELLPALTVFPNMVISVDRSSLTYTTLADLESRYDEIGQRYPQNYGWYQSRWHAAAADIYDAGGRKVFLDFWRALAGQHEDLESDEELAWFLAGKVHQSVADVLLKWDN